MPEPLTNDVETIKTAIVEAEREVDIAERHLKNSQLKLQCLQTQLQTVIMAGVSGLKINDDREATDTNVDETDEDRKKRIKRKWRVLGMKIKFGLGAQALATKRRNIKDASTFIDKETEVR